MTPLFATKQTYASYKNAKKVIEKVEAKYSVQLLENCRFLVGATEEGRFYPVVKLASNSTYLCRELIDQGLCVTN